MPCLRDAQVFSSLCEWILWNKHICNQYLNWLWSSPKVYSRIPRDWDHWCQVPRVHGRHIPIKRGRLETSRTKSLTISLLMKRSRSWLLRAFNEFHCMRTCTTITMTWKRRPLTPGQFLTMRVVWNSHMRNWVTCCPWRPERCKSFVWQRKRKAMLWTQSPIWRPRL